MRHILKLAASLLVAWAAACVEADLPDDAVHEAHAITCNDTRNGLYVAGTHPEWNPRQVTVVDYRSCDGSYLDGTTIAPGTAWQTPSFMPDGEYRVFAPKQTNLQSHKLLLYLAGSGATNSGREQILQRAAYLGYHVIALRYWNADGGGLGVCGRGPNDSGLFDSPITGCSGMNGEDCNTYTDATAISFDDCARRFYLNNFSNDPAHDYTNAHIGKPGDDCVPGSTDHRKCTGPIAGQKLNDADAVVYRARKLLTYLSRRYVGAGWDQFAIGGAGNYVVGLDSTKVTLMGHSTGGKVFFHAAHQLAFDRVIFLSGPNLLPTRTGAEPANLDSFFDTNGKTPLSKIFAFSNTADDNFDRADASWRNIKAVDGVGLRKAQITRPCTGVCRACGESPPLAPTIASNAHALEYSGNVDACLGGTVVGVDPDRAHMSTTWDASCAGATPDTCWFLAIWDYLLTRSS